MWPNHYEVQLIVEERRKDALRKEKQVRLIRAAKGSGKSRRLWWPAVLIPRRLMAVFIDRKVDEPRRRSPLAASSPTCEGCVSS